MTYSTEMNNIENISGLWEWIELLKSVKITEKNLADLKLFFSFSPERFARKNGLDEGFIKSIQSEKKKIHRRILDFEKITMLKKRKVSTFDFHYGYEKFKTRICVCQKTFANYGDRKKSDRYRFYETIKYNYAYVKNHFYGSDEHAIIIFDENGKQLHVSDGEFDQHFSDIRTSLIDDLLKSNE